MGRVKDYYQDFIEFDRARQDGNTVKMTILEWAQKYPDHYAMYDNKSGLYKGENLIGECRHIGANGIVSVEFVMGGWSAIWGDKVVEVAL